MKLNIDQSNTINIHVEIKLFLNRFEFQYCSN